MVLCNFLSNRLELIFIRWVHQQLIEVGDLLLFLVLFFTIAELEDGLLELVKDGAREEGHDFGKKLELFLLLVCR